MPERATRARKEYEYFIFAEYMQLRGDRLIALNE